MFFDGTKVCGGVQGEKYSFGYDVKLFFKNIYIIILKSNFCIFICQ
jgi:hypothetical protein